MERPSRLKAALAALTFPWLAPQMGCSLFDDTPSRTAISSPAQSALPPGTAKYSYEKPAAPGTNGQAGQPSAGTVVNASAVNVQPAQPPGSDSPPGKPATPPEKPATPPTANATPTQPAAPALEASDRPLPINLATALRLA